MYMYPYNFGCICISVGFEYDLGICTGLVGKY